MFINCWLELSCFFLVTLSVMILEGKSNTTWLPCCVIVTAARAMCCTTYYRSSFTTPAISDHNLSLLWECRIQWQANSSQAPIYTEFYCPLQWGNGRWVKNKPSIFQTVQPNRPNPSLPHYFTASAPEHVNEADSRYHPVTTAERVAASSNSCWLHRCITYGVLPYNCFFFFPSSPTLLQWIDVVASDV